jgi:DNA-binding transcriptional LysR family regulator
MIETIDLATLRVLVAAADLGSISAAGNHVNVSVAAASARISLLEGSLGFRIFDRSPRGVHPTPAGQMLLQRSRALLGDADRLANDLQDYSRGLKGHVRVLANASALLEVLPGLIESFARSHPLIRIDLEERGSHETPLALFEGRADIGVVDLPVAPTGLEFTDFFTDTLVVLASRQHPLAQRDRVAFHEVLDEDFIGLADSTALSHRMHGWASAAGKTLHLRLRMRSFDAVARMVAVGLGIGVLPLEAVGPQLAHLPIKAVPLTDAWATRTHRIARRNDVPLSPSAQTLVDALLSQPVSSRRRSEG